jgi:hypothetical protein
MKNFYHLFKDLVFSGLFIFFTLINGYSQQSDKSKLPTVKKAELPGEFTAEQILNGKYQWPVSVEVNMDRVTGAGFKKDVFGGVPAPGIHPRILFSPGDLPDIRNRIKTTNTGKLAYANLLRRQSMAKIEGTAFSNVYKALLSGDIVKAENLYSNYDKAGTSDGSSWHHRPNFMYILMLETFDCLIKDDQVHGKELAIVVSNLARIFQTRLDIIDSNGELVSDVWRSGRRSAIGDEPYFAFMYDFTYNWMDNKQREVSRNMLNDYSFGKTTMGSHMPHHFRRWNWIAVGSGLLLTNLATEGEKGNDSRVYRHTAEIMTDFVKYGWSDQGSSTEAIGYTQFGLRWGVPSLVAMARRGQNLYDLKRWYNQINWYAHSVQANGGQFISHGDGGDGGPTVENILTFKRAFPDNTLVDYVLQETIACQNKGNDKLDGGLGYLMDQVIFACDPSDKDYLSGKLSGINNTFFDPERNSLITHTNPGPNDIQLQFEARGDGIAASHQHADRGNFTLSGTGVVWALEYFRGIETRHHNCVIIDGNGQGYDSPPGQWLSLTDNANATFGYIDAKASFDNAWDGSLGGYTDVNDPRRQYRRWSGFTRNGDKFLSKNPGYDWRRYIDRSPVVEKFYDGFESGDPRMWDEYTRPVKVEYNPVKKAFRSAGVVRGVHPYVLITDDIQKDDKEHLYEWLMQVNPNVEVTRINTDEILLSQPSASDKKALLYIKVLERTLPVDIFKNPAIRLETFELKDARDWPEGRSFGLAKRLVIPSFSINPSFKILLFPHYNGEEKPQITWNETKTKLTVSWKDQKDEIEFMVDQSGKTNYRISRDGKAIMAMF